MPRGGKRKGAGAPKGNLNALKHGGYSRQFARIGALMALDPKVADGLIRARKRAEAEREEADELASLYLMAYLQRCKQIAAGEHKGGLDGLNLILPQDVSDSINEAASQALRKQTRKAARIYRNRIRANRDNQSQTQAG